MTAAVPRVAASGLVKAYGKHRVLDGASIELEAGAIVAIVGPNGAGKSTLLGCLAGTLAYQGEVRVDGNPRRATRPGTIALLPQRPRLPAAATVSEVLRLFDTMRGGHQNRVHLPDGFVPGAERRMGELSGGQAQRVALAAALAGAPDLILLDEPLVNLDDSGRAATIAALSEHRRGGATIVVASPTAVDLLTTVDRVVEVRDGQLADAGEASGFLGRLPMTVWVRRESGTELPIAGLSGLIRLRNLDDWVALETAEERVVTLLAELGERGIAADRIRIGAPHDTGSPSPSIPGARS